MEAHFIAQLLSVRAFDGVAGAVLNAVADAQVMPPNGHTDSNPPIAGIAALGIPQSGNAHPGTGRGDRPLNGIQNLGIRKTRRNLNRPNTGNPIEPLSIRTDWTRIPSEKTAPDKTKGKQNRRKRGKNKVHTLFHDAKILQRVACAGCSDVDQSEAERREDPQEGSRMD